MCRLPRKFSLASQLRACGTVVSSALVAHLRALPPCRLPASLGPRRSYAPAVLSCPRRSSRTCVRSLLVGSPQVSARVAATRLRYCRVLGARRAPACAPSLSAPRKSRPASQLRACGTVVSSALVAHLRALPPCRLRPRVWPASQLRACGTVVSSALVAHLRALPPCRLRPRV